MSLSVQGIKSVFQKPELGLLIIRLGLGVVLAINGWNKFSAGEATLHAIGANVKYIGLHIGSDNAFTLFFGIAAAGSELLGGILLIIGWLFRTATALLIVTMLVATLTTYYASQGDLSQFGYPMVIGCALLGLLFTGPGRISTQRD